MPHDPGQRLQKALSHLGLGSRREVEVWIRAGRLTVNGAAAQLGMRVRESDRIRLDGRLVRQRPAAAQQVFVCHRSPGEPLDASASASTPSGASMSSAAADSARHADPEHAPAREGLFDRLPRAGGRRFIAVSPMPQHDGGLELVTSDGELAERLQRAVRRLTGEFSIRLRGELDEAQLASVRSGALDSGKHLEVADCQAQGGEGANRWYVLAVRGASGKDVRQLFERSGAVVSRILRTRLGTVALDRALWRGRFRRLTPAELQRLLEEPIERQSDAQQRPDRRPRPARHPAQASPSVRDAERPARRTSAGRRPTGRRSSRR